MDGPKAIQGLTGRHGLKSEAKQPLPLRGGPAFRARTIPAGDKGWGASEFIPWLASAAAASLNRVDRAMIAIRS